MFSLSNFFVFTFYLSSESSARVQPFPNVYASLYEGFGIPILEAFARGVPVITSNCSSMPEVAGEAAILADPYEEESISQAIVNVCTDEGLCERLVQAGLVRNRRFNWTETALRIRANDQLLSETIWCYRFGIYYIKQELSDCSAS